MDKSHEAQISITLFPISPNILFWSNICHGCTCLDMYYEIVRIVMIALKIIDTCH